MSTLSIVNRALALVGLCVVGRYAKHWWLGVDGIESTKYRCGWRLTTRRDARRNPDGTTELARLLTEHRLNAQ